MILKDLEKNEPIKEIVNTIITDDDFKLKCKDYLEAIFEDGNVDKDDIPLLINVVLIIMNNYQKVKVTPKQMKPVFMLLIAKLLDNFKGNVMIDETLILNMLEPQLDILLMSMNGLKKIKFSCCASRPNEEHNEHMLNKIKLNKLEKEKLKQYETQKHRSLSPGYDD